MKLRLPLAPSANELLRMSWQKRHKLLKDFSWLIVQEVGNRHSVLNGVHITITRKTCGVAPDPDNLVASAKLILDGLQRAGVIKDDSPSSISLEAKWARAGKRREQGTDVEIKKWKLDQIQ
jgi:Holliday junction resolvase RusA-like endonuclease